MNYKSLEVDGHSEPIHNTIFQDRIEAPKAKWKHCFKKQNDVHQHQKYYRNTYFSYAYNVNNTYTHCINSLTPLYTFHLQYN